MLSKLSQSLQMNFWSISELIYGFQDNQLRSPSVQQGNWVSNWGSNNNPNYSWHDMFRGGMCYWSGVKYLDTTWADEGF